MSRKVTREELNGSLVRFESKMDEGAKEMSCLRTDVQLILQRLDFQKAQCSDCMSTMDVVTTRVNGLDSWRVTARRAWLALGGLIVLTGGILGILAAVHVI